jgi:hypothetical protein
MSKHYPYYPSAFKAASVDILAKDNPLYEESTIEVTNIIDGFGYKQNRRNRFDESQESEVHLTLLGMSDPQLSNIDY